MSYFLGMAYNNADPDWVRDAVAHRPDANTAVWLAWLDPQNTVATGREWGAWLDLGLSRGEVTSAVEAGLRGGSARWLRGGLRGGLARWLRGCARDLFSVIYAFFWLDGC